MNRLKVTADKRVFLDDVEITECLGFRVIEENGKGPKVVLQIEVEEVDIDGYTTAAKRRGSRT